MEPGSEPPPASDSGESPDGLDLLGQRAAALAAAAGHHAGLLIAEARFRMEQTIREAILSLAISATAIIAAVVGYGLLVRELAAWLGGMVAPNHPEPIRVLIYAAAAAIPLALLKLRAWWTNERALALLERAHRSPAP